MTDFTLPQMDRDQLDQLIINTGNSIARIGYTSTTAGPVKGQHDWGFRWVNTRGMGNHGTLVGIPRSSRARKVWRKAILNKVSKLTGTGFAKRYIDASKGIQYALEDAVIAFVYEQGHLLATSDLPTGWGQAERKFGKSVVDKAREEGLSFWRLIAASEVASKVYNL